MKQKSQEVILRILVRSRRGGCQFPGGYSIEQQNGNDTARKRGLSLVVSLLDR
jgi:hypothetical protein